MPVLWIINEQSGLLSHILDLQQSQQNTMTILKKEPFSLGFYALIQCVCVFWSWFRWAGDAASDPGGELQSRLCPGLPLPPCFLQSHVPNPVPRSGWALPSHTDHMIIWIHGTPFSVTLTFPCPFVGPLLFENSFEEHHICLGSSFFFITSDFISVHFLVRIIQIILIQPVRLMR